MTVKQLKTFAWTFMITLVLLVAAKVSLAEPEYEAWSTIVEEVWIEEYPEPEDGVIGVVHYMNKRTINGTDLYQLETSYGDVLVERDARLNNTDFTDDTIRIIDWPASILPETTEVTLPEGTSTKIRLLLWEGS